MKGTLLTLTLLMYFFSSNSFGCYYSSGYGPYAPTNLTVDMGDITTQSDASNGVVATTQGLMANFGGAPAPFSCGSTNSTSPVRTNVFVSGSSIQGSNVIYETNIPGIGLKIYYYTVQATDWGEEPFSPTQTPLKFTVIMPSPYYSKYHNMNSSIKVEVVKTGKVDKIQAGELFFTKESFMWADIGAPVNLANLTIKAKVTANTCDIDTSSPSNINLGTISAGELEFKGSVNSGTPFNIKLNCSGHTNVEMSIDGTEQSSEIMDLGVLAIQEGDGMASGVGIQILCNDKPVKFNNFFSVGDANNGQLIIPMLARIYRTVDRPIHGGYVLGKMIYTFNYR